MKGELKEKTRYIYDPVHGPVELTPMEWRLVNTRAFQRLRRIKQLGLVDLVFPGAEHSRFTHSLGTLAMMSTLLSHLTCQYKGLSKSLRKLEPTLRAAALLHDIGHFPLSHLFETVYRHWTERLGEDGDVTVTAPQPSRYLQEAASLFSSKPEENREYGHEEMSARVVRGRTEISKILDDEGIDPGVVARLICGDYVRKGIGQAPPGGPKVPVVAALLMTSSLDADRLDYMKRDCCETHMIYGQVDEAYISRMLLVAPAAEDKSQKVLALPLKAIRTADHYMLARFHFYTQIIYHKTALAFNTVAGALLLHMLRNKEMGPYDDSMSVQGLVNTDYFLDFTDQVFWNKVRLFLREDSLPGAWARTLYHRLRPNAFGVKEEFVPRGEAVGPSDTRDTEFQRFCETEKVDPDHSFFQDTSLRLADIDSSYGPRPTGKLAGDRTKALRVYDHKNNVAVCLADRDDSLTAKFAAQKWVRSATYTLDEAALSLPDLSAYERATREYVLRERAGSLNHELQRINLELEGLTGPGPRPVKR